MLKRLLYIIIIGITIASCSTKRQISKHNTKKHKPKVRTEKIEVEKLQKKTSRKYKLETQYRKYKGVPYKYGGTSIKGFDCSGFVQFTYKNLFKIELPRTTGLMLKEGIPISKRKLRIGDLVLFRTSKRYRHVGIFMGDNLFMHVSTKKGLMKSNLNNPYWSKHYLTSRRIL
ncbi:NlpC/P60 family protein [Ancylomarina sp. 16SWW S1-10-2]|uniref:NlpC/P60 family protein n=1 Tax=Ancylomarina sp. 16SWW S1-10-2 TaxID=2499681 RepID=UPI0012AE7DA0|nr:NlpC/P60 family protein [Ancylomarina sp. 16SWW S1-10-2]MRT92531.1 bifunctional murein DD-endopeptidase/murein LD-carboxypeptidase [Ancylomarina sp. 16SWW S1-10-2]